MTASATGSKTPWPNYGAVEGPSTQAEGSEGNRFVRAFDPEACASTNEIHTSKYTWYTFVPLNLFEQFHCLANVYFLFIALLQTIPSISITSGQPLLLMPLSFVLAVGAARDLYEDEKRKAADRAENERDVILLEAVGNEVTEKTVEWRDVRPGNVLRLERGQIVPADALLLGSSEPAGACAVETSNLDGETDHKPKVAALRVGSFQTAQLSEFADSQTSLQPSGRAQEQAQTLRKQLQAYEVHFEPPRADLYEFNAAMKRTGDQPLGVGVNSLLLRGCTLCQAEWVHCVVCYSGHDTRVMRNLQKPCFKASWLDTQMNEVILVIFFVQLLLCVVGGVCYAIWESTYYADSWYLEPNPSSRASALGFSILLKAATWLLQLNNMVPISLMVMMTTVKFLQGNFVQEDKACLDVNRKTASEPEGKKAEVHTSQVLESLGQVTHVFSDKTGTLTCNQMVYKACAVAGQKQPYGISETNSRAMTDPLVHKPSFVSDGEKNPEQTGSRAHVDFVDGREKFLRDVEEADVERQALMGNFLLCHALCHSVGIQSEETSKDDGAARQAEASSSPDQYWKGKGKKGEPRYSASSPDELALVWAAHDIGLIYEGLASASSKKSKPKFSMPTPRPSDGKAAPEASADVVGIGRRGSNLTLKEDVSVSLIDPSVAFEPYEARTSLKLRLRSEAEGDEGSLRSQKCVMSAVFAALGMDDEDCADHADYADPEVEVDLLELCEFDNDRKRMSVVVEYTDHRKVMLMKGADSSVLPHLPKEEKEEAAAQLDAFACTGLRTLCLAYRVLSNEEHAAWSERYRAALAAVSVDRAEQVQSLASELEEGPGLRLLGVTAIEDRLQEGVPETLEFMISAGLTVWVLTGDKMETAITIGKACRLLTEDVENIQITSTNYDDLSSDLEKYSARKGKMAITITGAALSVILKNGDGKENLREMFYKVARRCQTVICCRVSPRQKADVVNIVKDNHKNETGEQPITLAIGDGANDVSMITVAHVGVGLSGKEGAQAARSADFAIGQFRFLRRLIFVHGRESYRRNSVLVSYNFYKNLVLVLPPFFFGPFMAFSGQPFYEQILYQLYNVVFTFWPCVFFAILDRPVQDLKELEEDQRWYEPALKKEFFNVSKVFLCWIGTAILQGALLPIVGFTALGADADYLWLTGTGIFFWVVLCVNLALLRQLSLAMPIIVFVTIGCVLCFPALVLMLDLSGSSQLNGVYPLLFGGTSMQSMEYIMATFLVVVMFLCLGELITYATPKGPPTRSKSQKYMTSDLENSIPARS